MFSRAAVGAAATAAAGPSRRVTAKSARILGGRAISSDSPRRAQVGSTSADPAAGPSSPSSAIEQVKAPEAFTIPRRHARTHGVPVGTLHLRSYDTADLALFGHFALHAAYAFGIPCTSDMPLPSKRKLVTVIRSPFIFKKSQENFERVTHKRLIKFWDADMEVFNAYLRYLQMNELAGVDMRIVKWERLELGFGQKRLVDLVRQQEAEKSASSKRTPSLKTATEEVLKAQLAVARQADEILAFRSRRGKQTGDDGLDSNSHPSKIFKALQEIETASSQQEDLTDPSFAHEVTPGIAVHPEYPLEPGKTVHPALQSDVSTDVAEPVHLTNPALHVSGDASSKTTDLEELGAPLDAEAIGTPSAAESASGVSQRDAPKIPETVEEGADGQKRS